MLTADLRFCIPKKTKYFFRTNGKIITYNTTNSRNPLLDNQLDNYYI